MIVPEGFANVHFVFSVAGSPNEMGFGIGFEPDEAMSTEDIAREASLAFSATFFPTPTGLLTGWTYLGTRAAQTTFGEPALADYQTVIAGTQTLGGPPCNTAVLVKKVTGLGGRRHRGRLFMPPFNLEEDQISNAGQLGTTYMTSQVTKWGDVWDAWVAALLLPVLLHTDPATPATAITAFVPQSLAASQRRRMR